MFPCAYPTKPANTKPAISCENEKEHLRMEAPLRLKFAQEHPDQDANGNIVAVSEAWQYADCIAFDDPRLNQTSCRSAVGLLNRRRLAEKKPAHILVRAGRLT
jgi:hypothetical protein